MRAATGEALTPSGVAAGAAGAAARARSRCAGAAGAAAVEPPVLACMRAMTWPTVTVSPASTSSSVMTPVAGAGSSTSTLSVEISTIVSPSAISWPTSTCHSSSVPSVTDSPAAGVTMSMISPACVAAVGPPSAGAVCVSSADAESTGVPPLESASVGAAAPSGWISASTRADLDGVAVGDVDLHDGSGDRRRDLGVDLVGRDLDERLVGLDAVTLGLVPLQDRALGHRFAHRGQRDLDCRGDCHRGEREIALALTLHSRHRRRWASGFACWTAARRRCRARAARAPAGPSRRTVPRPPRTATATAERIDTTRARSAARISSTIAIQPSPWAESEDHLALRQAGHEPDDQQARVDRRVGEREPLEHGQREARRRAGGSPARRSCRRPVEHPRHPPQHLVGLVGPLRRRRPATRRDRRARGRASTSAPDGTQACPTNITIWWGSSTSASPRTRSGSTDHSSRSSRASVSTGFSSSSTEPPAPSAQRPGHVASHAARRPASQRPSPSRTTHSAATERLASPSTRRSAQRAGWRSRTSSPPSPCWWPTSRAATPSWLGEPRSASAATAASAALVTSGPGANCSSLQRAVTWSVDQGPRARMPGASLIRQRVRAPRGRALIGSRRGTET